MIVNKVTIELSKEEAIVFSNFLANLKNNELNALSLLIYGIKLLLLRHNLVILH